MFLFGRCFYYAASGLTAGERVRMYRKSERTVELYKSIGAKVRLLNDLLSDAEVAMSQVLPAAEADRMILKMDKIIGEATSHCENQMYKDHPELDNRHNDVFYGTLKSEPRNEIDAEMIGRAQMEAKKLAQNGEPLQYADGRGLLVAGRN